MSKYVAFKTEGKGVGQVYIVENGRFKRLGWGTYTQAEKFAKNINLKLVVK